MTVDTRRGCGPDTDPRNLPEQPRTLRWWPRRTRRAGELPGRRRKAAHGRGRAPQPGGVRGPLSSRTTLVRARWSAVAVPAQRSGITRLVCVIA